ncbi:hypothetical protein EAG_03328 [Camponotus floridanus]|uniref:Uncharacterized protein n=1 Tax=Camponotus floridanus TaxID=104421 RepID=E1ZWS9_CAMFO|nr:hypothetical protein EAG_03328 [Camponotus floridanus]
MENSSGSRITCACIMDETCANTADLATSATPVEIKRRSHCARTYCKYRQLLSPTVSAIAVGYDIPGSGRCSFVAEASYGPGFGDKSALPHAHSTTITGLRPAPAAAGCDQRRRLSLEQEKREEKSAQ